ncbi:MAG: hypothetical protein ACLFTT_16150 [Candidatus Hydrogenedentota bacterium]
MTAIPRDDPHVLIEAGRAPCRRAPDDRIDLQRRAWQALFAWCANQ